MRAWTPEEESNMTRMSAIQSASRAKAEADAAWAEVDRLMAGVVDEKLNAATPPRLRIVGDTPTGLYADDMKRAMRTLAAIVNGEPAVFANVLLTRKHGRVMASATNYDSTVDIPVGYDEGTDCSAMLSGASLSRVIHGAQCCTGPGGMRMDVTTCEAVFSHGPTTYTVPLAGNVTDWPTAHEFTSRAKLDCQRDVLASAWKRTAKMRSKDKARTNILGVHVRLCPLGVRLEATNGHMAQRLEMAGVLTSEPVDFVVCGKAVEAVTWFLAEGEDRITIEAGTMAARFINGDAVLTVLEEGAPFPNIDFLVTAETSGMRYVDRKAVLKAIGKSPKSGVNVTLAACGSAISLQVHDNGTGVGCAQHTISTHDGPDWHVLVAAHYLHAALSALADSRVHVGLTSDGYLYLNDAECMIVVCNIKESDPEPAEQEAHHASA